MKADTFAGHLREIFAGNSEVRVARPVKMADVRISGLDDLVTPSEVALAVANGGGCDKDDVRTGEIPDEHGIHLAEVSRYLGKEDRRSGQNPSWLGIGMRRRADGPPLAVLLLPEGWTRHAAVHVRR